MRASTNTILATATFAIYASARTDLEGCTSTDVSSPAGASLAWYVPGTGELCEFLDCGGGRAPPKTTVPGCPQYSGTETYSPSFLPGYQAAATSAPATTAAAQSTAEPADSSSEEVTTSSSFDWSALESDTAISSWDLYTTLGSATGPIPASTATSEAEITSSPASSPLTSESSTLVAQTTAAAGAASNGTTTGGRPANGTISNATASANPSAPISGSNAAGTAQAWVGSAGLVMGLGAIVAAL